MTRALFLLALASACGGGTDESGLSAWLRIQGAQFVAGPLPSPAAGPAVLSASINRPDIAPGLQDRALAIVSDPSASGILIGIQGDAGYWVLPAGPPDVQQSNQLKNQVPLAFSPLLPSGQFQLLVEAVSASGAVGPPAAITLHTQDDTVAPAGLAFTLSWDTEADLDLHVVDPSGQEIYWNAIALEGGVLDFDSNQSCIIDGRRRERISWASAPPSGQYQVRVDTPSLCAAPTAHWFVQAQLGGQVLRSVQGQSTHFDTRGLHARGAGLLVLEVDVP
ncbi:MAG TPA: hypothetical protein VGH20_15315 [Myxococcales bacterium]